MTVAWLVLAALTIVSPKDGEIVPTMKPGQKAYFSGERAERFLRMNNPSDRARLFRMGSTQMPLRLAWNGPTNDVVYLLTVMREGGRDELFSVSNRADIYVTNLELGCLYTWSIRQAGTVEKTSSTFRTEPAAPRLLRAGGVCNFRDLGGWSIVGGGRVRENLIFRSAGLRSSSKNRGGFFRKRIELGERRVTDSGIETLRKDFGIRTDLELRTPDETAGMNGTLLGTNVNWQCISFAAYDFIDNDVRGREPFAKIFRIFTRRSNYPVLMHCSGGRDRTGTLAFLLNGLLGVPEDDLCRDWETSIFSDTGANFTSDRIQRLLDYLQKLPGNTMRERIESYARSCGITDGEIAAFREIMTENNTTKENE